MSDNIRIITEENMRQYMQLLTSDEIFGITEDRFTSFAVFDEESDEPAGTMSVQIFPEYIRIERIFILPEFRHRGYASSLLDVIKERPEGARLPVRAFIEDNEDVRGLLEASGFKGQESTYTAISACLGAWTDLEAKIRKAVPDDYIKKIKTFRLDQIPPDLIRTFVMNARHDEILQFPGKVMDTERFSDISAICVLDNTIKAASMIEETDDYSQFTWCYGDDPYSMLISMFMVKKELEAEYGPDYRVRCLCANNKEEQAYTNMFSKYDRRIIYEYQFD